MEDGIRIRTVEAADRAAVLDLYRQHYWRSHCLFLNPAFYQWQFEHAPDSAVLGGDQSVVAVTRGGRLLAHFGLAVARCFFRSQPLQGAHILSWLTIPEARGRGLGHAILQSVIDRYDFLFSRSPLATSLPIFRRFQFRYFAQCRRWIAVLDADAALRLAVDACASASARAQARLVAGDRAGSYSIASRCPSGASRLARVVLADSLTFERDDRYFSWRYERHACLSYAFLWIGGEEAPAGVAVVRVEDVVGRPGRVLRVVEFLADPTCARQLGQAVFEFGKRQGCAFADVFGVSERFVAGFVSAGGFDTLEEPELRLPHLFQPWDAQIETPGLLFFAKPRAEGGGGLGYLDDATLIHVSKGDCSLDWPSWHPAAGAFAPPVVAKAG